jgi:hypothetical protein
VFAQEVMQDINYAKCYVNDEIPYHTKHLINIITVINDHRLLNPLTIVLIAY